MVVAAFVAPFLLPATERFVATAAALPNVSLGVVTAEPVERLSPELKQRLDGHWRVDDPLDPQQLVEAVRGLSKQMGPVERLVGALEQLQVPMAYAREVLGIDGMSVETALNVRDKSRMKSVLQAAGVPCARHQLVTDPDEALAFAEDVGFPLVAKPPAGAGARQHTGSMICLRCVAGSRRFLRTQRHPGCSRNSWSVTSTPSTA
jgi:biotin carboxylase